MRFLHTSDWHLGRTLHNVDLIGAQREVLRQITGIAADPDGTGVPVDAVLIAGDIYDRAVPPVEAVALFAEVLAELTRLTTVIVTSGNHDSAIRLGFGAELFTDRLHIRTALASIGQPVILGHVAVYPLPYLDPDVARVALSGDEAGVPLPRSHQAVMNAAMRLVRADLARRGDGVRSIVLAHAFVLGGQASESERSIAVGGVDHVASSTFDGIDYVALGHLHGAQQPRSTGPTMLRYSGSPLRYSFSEAGHRKSVSVVEFAADGQVSVIEHEVPQPRGMSDVRGPLAELLGDPELAAHEQDWVRVTVTDRARPDELFDRVRSRFPHALQVLHIPAGSEQPGLAPPTGSIQPPRQLGADFVAHVTGLPADPTELDLFEQAHDAALPAVGSA